MFRPSPDTVPGWESGNDNEDRDENKEGEDDNEGSKNSEETDDDDDDGDDGVPRLASVSERGVFFQDKDGRGYFPSTKKR